MPRLAQHPSLPEPAVLPMPRLAQHPSLPVPAESPPPGIMSSSTGVPEKKTYRKVYDELLDIAKRVHHDGAKGLFLHSIFNTEQFVDDLESFDQKALANEALEIASNITDKVSSVHISWVVYKAIMKACVGIEVEEIGNRILKLANKTIAIVDKIEDKKTKSKALQLIANDLKLIFDFDRFCYKEDNRDDLNKTFNILNIEKAIEVINEAKNTANDIEEKEDALNSISDALYVITYSLTEGNNFDKARKIANTIPNMSKRVDALLIISGKLDYNNLKLEILSEAERLAFEIEDEYVKQSKLDFISFARKA